MICEICEDEIASRVCKICGRRVCKNHFNEELQICKVCEITLCYICMSRFAVTVCAVCGKPICEKDSSKFGLYRICNRCLQLLHRE